MTTICPSELRCATNRNAATTQTLPVVVIDTREQRPYVFPQSVVRGLPTGDYSVEGLEDRIAVERKSKSDAYSSLGVNRERFQREMVRLSDYEYGAIVIEATLQDFLIAPEYSGLQPKAALCSLLAWSVKYGVHVFFAGDRRHGNALTAQLLEKFWRYHQGGV